MSNGFNFWEMCFNFGAVGEDMLKRAVDLDDLTKEEYKTITGQEYLQ
ncbi:XkdX family protein [Clostridium botulinum]|uniref:XkdX family protein n=1 Tax=Clostridium botulinum TaxID=1491 RepID=A0A846J685_CLOBO|nr:MULTISPECIES: XkdX family protein [Clostridium]NFH66123.1 XkdX family protein [Clostridium botulinum]ACA55863.1 hypothetical protein CLK_1316 [Clostridium botulinum A3 str. Loch Maree]NFJ08730.1 XkdX family protein [Clostridium botulinum]NFK15126.1 XkdX family protein [Clostridium botulinum]NFM93086.1 XkdX family protein [Clostridium botulinum]